MVDPVCQHSVEDTKRMVNFYSYKNNKSAPHGSQSVTADTISTELYDS